MTQPLVDIPLEGPTLFAFRIFVSLALAELSYRYLEPFIRRRVTVLPTLFTIYHKPFITAATIPGCAVIVYLIFSLSPAANALLISDATPAEQRPDPHSGAVTPEGSEQSHSHAMASPRLGDDAAVDEPARPAVLSNGENPTASRPTPDVGATPAGEETLTGSTEPEDPASQATAAAVLSPNDVTICSESLIDAVCAPGNRRTLRYETKNHKRFYVRAYTPEERSAAVVAVGDSVMVGAAGELLRRVPGMAIDAQVGRQFASGYTLLAALKKRKHLGAVVVIHLGNNGPLGSRQIEEMVQLLADTTAIILVNLKLPRNYEAANNNLLIEASRKYVQVRLLDWRTISAHGSNIFAQDGIHLTANGAQLYANMIAASLLQIDVLRTATK